LPVTYGMVLTFSIKNGVDPMSRSIEKSRVEDATDRTKSWQLTEILDPVQCRSVTMPDNTDSFSKVCWLLNLWDCYNSIANFVFFSALMFRFIYRLYGFYIQILLLVFWPLVQMVSKSFGNGLAMNKILLGR